MRTNFSRGEKIFDTVNYTLMLILAVIFLYPFLYTVSRSLSDSAHIIRGSVWLLPQGLNLEAYRALLDDSSIVRSILYTLAMTLSGVFLSIVMTTLAAFPLSKKHLRGRNLFMTIIIITMYFRGGLIPDYILIKNLNLLDSMGALVLPVLINTFNMIIMMNFFRGIPESLEEVAKIEGANNFQILLKIAIPLSLPMLATLTIFYSVGYWNTFFSALMYIQDPDKYVLQVMLYHVLDNAEAVMNEMYLQASQELSAGSSSVIPENLKSAMVIITAGPILVIYPFLQKYFVKGARVGAIKG